MLGGTAADGQYHQTQVAWGTSANSHRPATAIRSNSIGLRPKCSPKVIRGKGSTLHWWSVTESLYPKSASGRGGLATAGGATVPMTTGEEDGWAGRVLTGKPFLP